MSLLAVAITSVAFAAADVPFGPGPLARLWEKAVATSRPCQPYDQRAALDATPLGVCRRDPACLGRSAAKAGTEAVFALNASGANEVSLDVAVVRRDGSFAGQKALVVDRKQALRGLRILAAQACSSLGDPNAVALDIGLDDGPSIDESAADRELLASQPGLMADALEADLPPPPALEPVPAAALPAAPSVALVPTPPAEAPAAAVTPAAPALPPATLAPAPAAPSVAVLAAGGTGLVAVVAASILGLQTLGAAADRDATRDRPTWRAQQGTAESLAFATNLAWTVGALGLSAAGFLALED